MNTKQTRANRTEDAALMNRVALKDTEAFARVYDKYKQKAFAVIVRVVKHEDDAKELVQDVFLQIWKKADCFVASKGSLAGWIIAIAHNIALNHIRLRTFKNRTLEDKYTYEQFTHFLSPKTIDYITPLDQSIETETASQLQALIDALPIAQKVAITEAYFNDQSQREIAKRFNVPLGTVKTRLHQAVKKMRNSINFEQPPINTEFYHMPVAINSL